MTLQEYEAKYPNIVWCVDISISFSHQIHSKLFLTEEEAKAYYDRFEAPGDYRKMYKCRDIWNFTERMSKVKH